MDSMTELWDTILRDGGGSSVGGGGGGGSTLAESPAAAWDLAVQHVVPNLLADGSGAASRPCERF